MNSDRIELATQQETGNTDNICDLIYHGLHVLLLRRHNFLKMQRLKPAREANPANAPRVPPVLQPIIGLLQYQTFCRRIKLELDKVTQALAVISIISSLRFTPVGETGQDLLDLVDKGETRLMSGEALIRIDNRCASTILFLMYDSESTIQLWHTLVVRGTVIINSSFISSNYSNYICPSTLSTLA